MPNEKCKYCNGLGYIIRNPSPQKNIIHLPYIESCPYCKKNKYKHKKKDEKELQDNNDK